MNTPTTFDLKTLPVDQLDQLADDLFRAVIKRRSDATENEGIISDAEIIARLMGQLVLKEDSKTPNKKDGHLYQDERYTIRVDAWNNAQTITFQGRVVWDADAEVFLPDDEWMAWVKTMAQTLRDQAQADKEADQRRRLLQDLDKMLIGTEFTSVTAALEHFQLGPFEPAPATPAMEAVTERKPSADDIRRQILVAGLGDMYHSAVRLATLRLIRQQFGLNSSDLDLCQAVVARIEDVAEFDDVRREAVATAWHWMNWWGGSQTLVSQALLRLMNQGGPEAQIVLEGMALLGTGQPQTDDDCE